MATIIDLTNDDEDTVIQTPIVAKQGIIRSKPDDSDSDNDSDDDSKAPSKKSRFMARKTCGFLHKLNGEDIEGLLRFVSAWTGDSENEADYEDNDAIMDETHNIIAKWQKEWSWNTTNPGDALYKITNLLNYEK